MTYPRIPAQLVLAPVALIALVAASSSCRPTGETASTTTKPPSTNIIATVAGQPITLEAFQRALQLRVGPGASSQPTLEQKKEALEMLVRREAMYAKAREAGFDARPEIQEAIRNLVVGRFQEQQFKPAPIRITDEELAAAYQANLARYQEPAAVRGAIIFLSMPAKATPEKQAEFYERATALWKEAQAAPDDAAFATLVARHSDDRPRRYRGGDLGWLTREKGFEPSVDAALFALQRPGEIAPLVKTSNGAYIVRLLEKREAGAKPLAEVQEALRFTLTREKAAEQEAAFFNSMKQGLDLQVNQSALESFQLPIASKPDQPPSTPGR